MATKHDQLMKELLAAFPDQFLRLAAPDVAERVELDTVAFEPEEHYPGAHSLGLSGANASEYLARPEPLAWALAALMRPARGQSRPQLGLECVRQIAVAPDLDANKRELLFRCVWMYGQFEGHEAREFDKIMAKLTYDEVQEMKMSMAQWWKKEGLEEGRKQGLKQGEASILKRQLKRRFDQLPDWIDQRLEQASRRELKGWADRILDAERLEDVFSSA